MRIRKIKDKDVAGASALMQKSGIRVDAPSLTIRLHDFQYKRNHAVVVIWYRGRMISLMHVGIEPSLTSDRIACIFSMFIDRDIAPPGIEDNLVAYAQEWSGQHGCTGDIERRDIKATYSVKKAL